MDIIENLYRANDTFVEKADINAFQNRSDYQHKAMTDLKLLSYFALLSRENLAITPKQFEQISIKATECLNLLGGWINNDRRRFKP